MLPKNFPNHVYRVEEVQPVSETEKSDIVNSPIPNDTLERIFEDFSDVINDKLSTKRMTGPTMRIHLEREYKPLRVTLTRQIPLHWQEEANDLVSKLLADEVISPVSDVTEWISPAHFVPKEGGKAGL